MQPTFLFTCEHGGHEIPSGYQALFRGASPTLRSHRGWDPGALELAEHFAARQSAPLFSSTVSRLLIELNRSLHHRALFSEFTRDLDAATKQTLIETYYLPHRQAVEEAIAKLVAQGKKVLHIGVHSFTPELHGEVRNAEIGLLYDPRRAWEKAFCAQWQQALRTAAPDLRVRKNYPYLGTGDGFTTYLRTRFSNAKYAGIELEVNQRFALGPRATWKKVQEAIVASLIDTNPKR